MTRENLGERNSEQETDKQIHRDLREIDRLKDSLVDRSDRFETGGMKRMIDKMINKNPAERERERRERKRERKRERERE